MLGTSHFEVNGLGLEVSFLKTFLHSRRYQVRKMDRIDFHLSQIS